MKPYAFALIPFTLLLSACWTSPADEDATSSGTGLRVESGSGYIRRETINMAMPQGTPEVPGHGKEVGIAYGAVSGVENIAANGIASVHYMQDRTAIVGVQVNIDVPEDGYFYEAWLSRGDGTAPLSLGHLTNPFNDTRHSLQEEIDENLSGLLNLSITLEADDGNPDASDVVATAILKPTRR